MGQYAMLVKTDGEISARLSMTVRSINLFKGPPESLEFRLCVYIELTVTINRLFNKSTDMY